MGYRTPISRFASKDFEIDSIYEYRDGSAAVSEKIHCNPKENPLSPSSSLCVSGSAKGAVGSSPSRYF